MGVLSLFLRPHVQSMPPKFESRARKQCQIALCKENEYLLINCINKNVQKQRVKGAKVERTQPVHVDKVKTEIAELKRISKELPKHKKSPPIEEHETLSDNIAQSVTSLSNMSTPISERIQRSVSKSKVSDPEALKAAVVTKSLRQYNKIFKGGPKYTTD